MRVIKVVTEAAPIAIVLAVMVWLGFYYLFPDAPLGPGETALVLFVIGLGVSVGRHLHQSRKAALRSKNHEPAE